VADGSVTLEQAAAIEEFAGEEKAYARPVRAAGNPSGLHYALADEQHRRRVDDRKAASRVGLRDAGVRIIGKPKDWRWSSVEARVEDLTGPGARVADRRGARGVSGARGVHRSGERGAGVRLPAPEGLGSRRARHLPAQTKEEAAVAAEAAEAAKAEREFQTALTIAGQARGSFLHEYLTRKGRPPAGAFRAALGMLCRFDTAAEPRVTAARLLHPSVDDADPRGTGRAEAALAEAVDRSAENRLPYLALAYAAASAEANLRCWPSPWRFDPAFAIHWLDLIAAVGYPLTDAETRLRELAVRQLANGDEDDEHDEGEGSVDGDETAVADDPDRAEPGEGPDAGGGE
jgi:hypothetical protein